MKFLTTVALALLLASTATAATFLIDGDTIDVDGTRIRISNIDTPETFRPRCERELVLGLKAKERLRALLDAGPVTFTPSGKDVLQLSAGACATGAGLGTGCDDHHRRRHDRHRADPVV